MFGPIKNDPKKVQTIGKVSYTFKCEETFIESFQYNFEGLIQLEVAFFSGLTENEIYKIYFYCFILSPIVDFHFQADIFHIKKQTKTNKQRITQIFLLVKNSRTLTLYFKAG